MPLAVGDPGGHHPAMLGPARRIVAGIILIVVGLAILSVGGQSAGRVPVVLSAAWGASALAVLAGEAWGRILGLVVSVVGLAIGASLATAGIASPFATLIFSGADAARWYVVMPVGYGLAILSAVAGVLLLLPFPAAPRASERSARPALDDPAPNDPAPNETGDVGDGPGRSG